MGSRLLWQERHGGEKGLYGPGAGPEEPALGADCEEVPGIHPSLKIPCRDVATACCLELSQWEARSRKHLALLLGRERIGQWRGLCLCWGGCRSDRAGEPHSRPPAGVPRREEQVEGWEEAVRLVWMKDLEVKSVFPFLLHQVKNLSVLLNLSKKQFFVSFFLLFLYFYLCLYDLYYFLNMWLWFSCSFLFP